MTDTILNVATFPGDGIGPDVIESAIQIIKKASIKVDNLNINWNYIFFVKSFFNEFFT